MPLGGAAAEFQVAILDEQLGAFLRKITLCIETFRRVRLFDYNVHNAKHNSTVHDDYTTKHNSITHDNYVADDYTSNHNYATHNDTGRTTSVRGICVG